jgi:hypothetical protein
VDTARGGQISTEVGNRLLRSTGHKGEWGTPGAKYKGSLNSLGGFFPIDSIQQEH